MKQITHEKVNRDSIYLLYRKTFNSEKDLIFFRVEDEFAHIIFRMTCGCDMYNNLTVHEQFVHDNRSRHTVKFFKEISVDGSAIFILTDDESKMFVADFV